MLPDFVCVTGAAGARFADRPDAAGPYSRSLWRASNKDLAGGAHHGESRPRPRAARHWSAPISRARRPCSKRCSSPPAPPTGAAASETATRSATTRPKRARGRCRPRSTSPTRPFSAIPGPSSIAPARSSSPGRRSARMLAADVAVVVCEPEVERALTLGPLFKFLDDHNDPAHGVHQQARHRQRAGQRGAGGAAIGLAAAAGAAPGAAARRRGRDHRLCRSRQRARLPLQARARPPTSIKLPDGVLPTRSGRPAPASSRSSPISTTSCWSSCSRTCSPRRRRFTAT